MVKLFVIVILKLMCEWQGITRMGPPAQIIMVAMILIGVILMKPMLQWLHFVKYLLALFTLPLAVLVVYRTLRQCPLQEVKVILIVIVVVHVRSSWQVNRIVSVLFIRSSMTTPMSSTIRSL